MHLLHDPEVKGKLVLRWTLWFRSKYLWRGAEGKGHSCSRDKEKTSVFKAIGHGTVK